MKQGLQFVLFSGRKLDEGYLRALEAIRRGNLDERKRWLKKLKRDKKVMRTKADDCEDNTIGNKGFPNLKS